MASTPLPPISKSGVTKLTCYCATDYGSVSSVLSAYKDSDVAALAGLISRGKAMKLDQGTKVYIAGRDQGVHTVLIESGFHSGEKCYICGRFVE